MTKHGLGRGLDRLMNGDAVAGRAGAPGKDAAAKDAPAAPPARKAQETGTAVSVGKGLGSLLDAPRPKAAPQPAPTAPPDGSAKPWQRPVQHGAPAPAKAQRKEILPAWFFFAADILLLAFCVAITFDAPKPLGAGLVLFCSATIAFGAVLGVAGAIKSR
jgi:hypothetical protein